MSKRFGRNRRRAMEARISQLEDAHKMDRALQAHMRGTLDRQNSTIQRVQRILGDYFIALEPRTLRTDAHNIRVPKPIEMANVEMLSGTTMCEVLDRNLTVLERVDFRTHRDALTAKMHIRVATPLGTAGYAFSDGAFQYMPKQDAIRHLSGELARCLLSDSELKRAL